MARVSYDNVGRPVQWQKGGRGSHEVQTGVLIDIVPEGISGQEVYDTVKERCVKANKFLGEQGKPALPVDLNRLEIGRRHISWALETTKTTRALVMVPHSTGDARKRQWFCPSIEKVDLS